MVKNIEFSAIVSELSEEFDALIDERQDIREKTAKLNSRAEEIDRKLQAIQQTLQGLSLYSTAQEAPTELTKKTLLNLQSIAEQMSRSFAQIGATDTPKTLSECCRDILRKKGDWMSAVQVREALNAAGFDFSSYTSNPLSSIHTTLKRLAQDELQTTTRAEGQVYRWNKDEMDARAAEGQKERAKK
jgi:ABC-type transporter Mla subunit MlaD